MNPDLTDLDWKDFEILVADLWSEFGYTTNLTSEGRDGGIDIVAERKLPFPERIAIQAKRYSTDNKIGASKIREYSSLTQRQNIDIVVVVTTSFFTSTAMSEASSLGVKLVDITQLKKIIDDLEYELEDTKQIQLEDTKKIIQHQPKYLNTFKTHKKEHSEGDFDDFIEFGWNYQFHNGHHMGRLETKEQVTKMKKFVTECPFISKNWSDIAGDNLNQNEFINFGFVSDRMEGLNDWDPLEEAYIAEKVLDEIF